MKLLVSALEPSSNLHLQEMLKHTKNIELMGIFSASLGDPLHDISKMAIMGIVDALKKLRWFYRVADEMVELAAKCDKILLMDSSGFNLPLAKKIKAKYPDKEIIYYILPQTWASRPKRVKKLEKYCDRLLGILPFEIEQYKSGKAQYVGHPLLDEIKTERMNFDKNRVAFLAGSRAGEITRLMPIFREVRKNLSDKKATLVIPASFDDQKIARLYGDINDFEISRDTHTALEESEFAFICSGTATLEAAIIGTPFTLVYIAKKLDFFIGKKLLNIKLVGLANILLEKYNGTLLHEEFLQDEANAENLLNAYRQTDRAKFAKSAKALRDYLSHGSSEIVANIIMEQ
ncbi:MAG: lipid-A-disaccharide synthase [Campylobacterales bacterium]|nr:lipid-A-disaccharide synthase [Campylobacterales bacterium]